MTADILIVEDDPRTREVIALCLRRDAWRVRAESTVSAALSALATLPSLLVVDLGLPDGSGVEVIRAAHARWPGLPALVLTVASDRGSVLAAIGAGARGYLLKEELVVRLPTAVEEILEGGVPLSGPVAQLLLAELRGSPAAVEAHGEALTPREQEVLEHLAHSLTYEQVGELLGVSVNTIRTYVRNLYAKLDVSTRTEAILAGLKRGLLQR